MAAETIGQVLAFGVGVALSPLAVVAVVTLIGAEGGRAGAWAFTAAWTASLAVVVTAALLVADAADAAEDGPATWTSVVRIVLGLALLALAAGRWRRRGAAAGPDAEAPGWQRRLDGLTPSGAAVLAVLLAALKPKNPLLAIGAGVSIAQVGAPAGAQAAGVAAFVALGALAPGLPLAVSVLAPARSVRMLDGVREWMTRQSDAIVAVLLVVLAAKLLGDALVALGG